MSKNKHIELSKSGEDIMVMVNANPSDIERTHTGEVVFQLHDFSEDEREKAYNEIDSVLGPSHNLSHFMKYQKVRVTIDVTQVTASSKVIRDVLDTIDRVLYNLRNKRDIEEQILEGV